MRTFARRTWEIIARPNSFFDSVRDEGWWPAYRYFLSTTLSLAILSPLGWAAGINGASPINSSLSVQMQIYPFWQEQLARYGFWRYPIAALLIPYGIHLLMVVLTLLEHAIFRLLGGAGPVRMPSRVSATGLPPRCCSASCPALAS